MKPKEGTILTVAKAMSTKAMEIAEETDDIIRFMIKGTNMNVYCGKSWFCKDPEADRHTDIFPIPQDALDGNPKLKQNPGYTAAN